MGLLNLVTVGAKITALIANGIIGAVNAGGMSLVSPASVAGTGVSVTALGKITFSAATAVNVNGCFTPTYDNYMIKIDATMSTTAAISMVLRASGADSVAANYDAQSISGVGTTAPASGQTLAGTSWALSAASQVLQKISLDLDGPALASSAYGVATSAASPNPPTAAAATLVRQVSNRLTTPFDGFTITAASGTMTGVARIYGFNNG